MSISVQDLTELKRISTNAYADDKACINRLIKGISDFKNEIRLLKIENENLKKELAEIRNPTV